jgi:DNA-binding CsgD family transcriptional regulator
VAEAEETVRDPAATAPTRIVALFALGRVRACRGEDPWPVLDEALALAEATGELQRVAPVRVGRAEAAWLAGDLDRAADEAMRGLELAVLRANRLRGGELALWLHRSGHRPVPSVDVAEPYALELAGDWAAAAAFWEQRGFPLHAARARSEGGDEAAIRAALATFERLGAKPDAARAARRLRSLGVRSIPRGPRPTTRVNPAQLTEREVEVLGPVAAGKSNREIATQLFLSPKTAGHHVSAILA